MAGGRPHARNAQYVAHWANPNNRVKYIERRYGKTGYVVYYRLREALTSAEDHYLHFQDEHALMFFASDCWESSETVYDILNALAEVGEIDPDLWRLKVVASDSFFADISVAYKLRKNPAPTINTIRQRFNLQPLANDEVEAPEIEAPTLESVLHFAQGNFEGEKYLKRKATKFFNHYAAKGWKINGHPVEDWTALLNNWIEKDRENEQNSNSQNAPKSGKPTKASNQTGERQNFR